MGPAAGGLQGIGCGVAWDLRTLQGAARLRPFDFAQGRLRGTAEAAVATWVVLVGTSSFRDGAKVFSYVPGECGVRVGELWA